ncbi:MAG: type II toxin-antitoxin system RelE/ParE family toxin [Lachnospiraceae bacterium]|nr:type II toxin-antitoxin system RelE/ParE family toxin [Lachnospiraceae bacterium]
MFPKRNTREALTNGFIKKTAKTPRKEIVTALERKKDYESKNKKR